MRTLDEDTRVFSFFSIGLALFWEFYSSSISDPESMYCNWENVSLCCNHMQILSNIRIDKQLPVQMNDHDLLAVAMQQTCVHAILIHVVYMCVVLLLVASDVCVV